MNKLGEIISQNEETIRAEWLKHMTAAVQRADLMSNVELQEQSRSLLDAIKRGASSSQPEDVSGPAWSAARESLQDLSVSRAHQGFTPSETATFVLSLKQPLFSHIRRELSGDQTAMFETLWTCTSLIDKLALLTAEAYIHQALDHQLADDGDAMRHALEVALGCLKVALGSSSENRVLQ